MAMAEAEIAIFVGFCSDSSPMEHLGNGQQL